MMRLKDHVRQIMALSVWIVTALLWSGVAHAQIPTLQDVVWGSFSQTTATYPTVGQGSRLQKTSGTTTWAGDAFSNGWISGDGYVEFRFAQNNQGAMLGLSAVNTDHTWTSVDYGIRGTSSGFEIAESGTVRTPNGKAILDGTATLNYTPADVFRIERLNGTVQYFKNGTLIHTSSVKSVGLLFVDTAFNQVGAAIEGARYYGPDDVKDIWWETLSAGVAADYTVSTNTGTRLESTATAGTAVGAWGSRATIGDGYLQFRFEQINKRIGVGLSATNPDNTIDSIMYGIEATATSGQARILEPGNRTSPVFTYVASDFFRVQREGSKISYYKNDQLIAVSSVPASQGPLYPDIAFTGPGAIQNAKISGLAPTEKVVWRITSSITASYPSGRSQLVKSTTAGWNADAVSYKAIPRDGFVRFLFGQLNKVAQVGLGGIALDVTAANTPFAIRNLGNGTVQAYENGVAVGTLQAAQPDDYFLIRRGGGKVQYIQNGTVFHEHATSNTGSLYTHAQIYDGSGQSQIFSCEYSGVPEDVQWQDRFQTKADYPFPGAGSKLTKTAATAAWDSDAVSTQSIAGDGYVEFNFAQTNKDLIFGLTDTNTGHGNSTLKYVIKTQPTANPVTAAVWQNGAGVGVNVSFVATDVFRIERKGSTVTYLKNGVAFYTSLVPSTGPLIVDDSFLDNNGSVQFAQVYAAPTDIDGDGLDDAWEYRYFGSLQDADQGGGNYDGDAFTNREEFEQGLDPLDYYNGVIPTVGIVSGNNQIGTQEDFFALPLVVDVRDTASGLMLSEAPVTFSIASGAPLLATSKTTGTQLESSLDRTTNVQTGLASVYVKQSTGFGTKTFVTVSGGGSNPATFVLKTDPTIALWRFNDPDGSTTVADSSRGGNVGTLQGGAALTTATGFDGSKGVVLNGTGAHITVPHNSNSLNLGSNPFTIAGWFKLASGTSLSSDSNCYGILSKGSTTGPGFDVAVRGGNYKGFWVRMATGSATVELTPSVDRRALLSDGKWHHFVVVREVSQALTLYLDGSLAGTAAAVSSLDNTLGLRIGVTTANAYFNGTLDQISLSADALSAADVTARWNQEANVDSDLDGMLDRWEAEQFGNLTKATATSDFDLDGLNDVDEFRAGLDPKTSNQLTKIAGDNQTGPASSVLSNRLQAKVSTATAATIGAPVTFSITQGEGSLSVDGVQWSSSVSLPTDQNGIAQVYWRLGRYGSSNNQVLVQFGNTQSVEFSARSNDLVGRWRFEEASGTVADDASGVGNNGVLANPNRESPFIEGKKAVQFDGGVGAQNLQLSNTGNRLIPGVSSQPFTLAMWFKIKPDGTTAPNLYTLTTNETYLASGFRFGVDHELNFPTQYFPGVPNKPRLAFWSGQSGGSLFLLQQTSLQTDVWYHVAIVYTGTGGSMYINGQLAATASGTIVPNANPINVGGAIGGTRDFNGSIDDVRIYSKALTAAEVAAEVEVILNADDDGDGLTNYDEVNIYHTDSTVADSDHDGLPDGWEVTNNLNPKWNGDRYLDLDGDGLTNEEEFQFGGRADLADTDNDGLDDGFEAILETSLLKADTDNDGLPDRWEIEYGFDPKVPTLGDSDGDHLSDLAEFQAGTNPLRADSDWDGIPDGWEISHGLNPLDGTDASSDYDNNGRSALDEFRNAPDTDTDGDGLPDAWERQFGFDPFRTDGNYNDIPDQEEDWDGDGRPNCWEFRYGKNPLVADNPAPEGTVRNLRATKTDDGGDDLTWDLLPNPAPQITLYVQRADGSWRLLVTLPPDVTNFHVAPVMLQEGEK